jgi:microcompartment protein CcmL/EutN
VKPSFDEFDAGAMAAGPALGLLEIASIAEGFAAADRVVKAAPVRLLLCRAASPGKHLVLFAGEVAAVTASLRAGSEGLSRPPLDTLLLPQADPGVVAALASPRRKVAIDAAGIVECATVATLLVAADVAVKTADVELLAIRAAVGLGGKSYFVCSGEVAQVRAAVNAAAGFAQSRDQLVGQVVLPQPHRDLDAWLA